MSRGRDRKSDWRFLQSLPGSGSLTRSAINYQSGAVTRASGIFSGLIVAAVVPREERRERMQLMRRTVKENNVYRWAGRMLMDAARVRQRQSLARREVPSLRRLVS